MKILILIKSILVISIVTIVLLVTGCSGGSQLPPEVCTYGEMVCNTGNYVCENFPVPEPICTYFNLACINLSVLCEFEPGTPEYKAAIESLDSINVVMGNYLDSVQAKK